MSDIVAADVSKDELLTESDASKFDEEIVGEDLPLSESQIKRNMFYIIALDTIYATGSTDFGVALTPLLVYLNASNQLIGIIAGLGWPALFGTIVSPWISRKFPAKKWYFFWTNVPYNLCIGLIGAMLLLSHRFELSHVWLLSFVFIMVAFWNFFAGFVGLPSQEFIAGAIPMSHRGRFSGLSGTFGAAFGFGATFIAYYFLKHYTKPMSFGVIFVMAYILLQGSFFIALFAKERRVPVEKVPRAWSKDMLKVAWENKPWLRMILLYALNYLLILPMWNFVQVYGLKGLKMPAETSALMMNIYKVSAFCMYPFIGFIADKWSPKRILPYWPFVVAVGILPILIFHNTMAVYISVGIGSATVAMVTVSFTVIMYGLPKPEHRAGLYTLQAIVLYIVIFVGQLFMGTAIDKFGYIPVYTGMFIIALLLFPVTKWAVAPLSSDPKSYG